jgi:hypothetical protein
MPDTLQNKLLKTEIAPPAGLWEKISASLDEEFIATDYIIAAKIDTAEITAPEGVWNKIDEQLHPVLSEQGSETKVIPLVYRRIAIAAALIGLIAVAVMYLNREKQEAPTVVKTETQTPAPQPKKQIPASPSTVLADNTPVKPIIAQEKSVATNKIFERRRSTANESIIAMTSKEPEEEPMVSPEQAPLYELTTVSALQPVSVSAPPLRDKKGNLILDMTTLCNTRDDYITVTGPNGKQTKISNKFLSCIGYMNSNAASSEMDARALRCKLQFEEWRNRLLSEPGFIPTANNFFDSIELKDMLQEM